MNIQFPVYKYGLIFRLVEETDAEFIHTLRTDVKVAKHLTPVDDDLQQQVHWIRRYKMREAKGEEYYFIFETLSHERLGVVRIYDFTVDSFKSGSWLMKPGCDEFAAIKLDLFSSAFGYKTLGLKKCFFFVRKNNKKILRFHKMFAEQVNEDADNVYFVMSDGAFDKKCTYLNSIIEVESETIG